MSGDSRPGAGTPDGRAMGQQPKWRRDFPIDWSQDEYVSRRDLVKFVVLTSLAFAAGQWWLAAKGKLAGRRGRPAARAVAGVEEIPVGGSKLFTYPEGDDTPRLLVRTGPSAFVAYDQQCTHLLCPVIPRVEEGTLLCPCHHGVFDLATGQPLQGPPRRPLTRVLLEVRQDQVWAMGLQPGAS